MPHDLVLQSIRVKAQEVLPSSAALLLLGSRARGEANEGSEWDLHVLLDKDQLDQSDFGNYAFMPLNLHASMINRKTIICSK